MTGREFFHIVEIRTKIVSISSLSIGICYTLLRGSLHLQNLILLVCAALAVDMGTTAFNSYYDYKRKVDSKRYNREDDKVLLKGKTKPEAVLILSLALYLIGAFIGLALAFSAGWPVLLFGTGGMLVGFLYNGGPLPISRTPLGELFAGGFLGEVLILAVIYVQTGRLDGRSIFIGIPSTLLIASILTVNNTCDMKGDAAAGRKTLSLLIGKTASRAAILLFGTGAYALLLLYTLPEPRILPKEILFTAPPAAAYSLYEYIRMQVRGFSHDTKGANIGSIIRIFAMFTAALTAALLIGYFR